MKVKEYRLSLLPSPYDPSTPRIKRQHVRPIRPNLRDDLWYHCLPKFLNQNQIIVETKSFVAITRIAVASGLPEDGRTIWPGRRTSGWPGAALPKIPRRKGFANP